MSWSIIVASDQAYQLDELMNGAHEIAAQISSSGSTPVMDATSVEDVLKRRRFASGRNQLLIIAASLPDQRSSPRSTGAAGI